MIRHQLASKIQASIDSLIQEGLIPAADYRSVSLEEPRNAAHGDFAIGWAMQASKLAGKNPRELGDLLAARLSALPEFSSVEVAGPGFINLTLTDDFAASYLSSILQSEGKKVAEGHYAFSPTPNPKRINVEFVSVNPNGPITIGSGRGAAYGSTLCNVLCSVGHTVHREYYINDGTSSEQMRIFAESVSNFLSNLPAKENAYKGEYVKQTSDRLRDIDKEALILLSEVRKWLSRWAPLYHWDIELLIHRFQSLVSEDMREFGAPCHVLDNLFSKMPEDAFDLLTLNWALISINRIGHQSLRRILNRPGQINLAREPRLLKSLGHALTLSDSQQWLNQYSGKIGSPFREVLNANNLLRSTESKYSGKYVSFYVLKPHETRSSNLNNLEFSYFEELQSEAETMPNPNDWQALVVKVEESFGIPIRRDFQMIRYLAEEAMIREQENALTQFGVTFDTWSSEQSYHEAGDVQKDVEHLISTGAASDEPHRTIIKFKKGGVIEEVRNELQVTDEDDSADGTLPTLWLRSTKFGDDMDRVLRRRDGRLTYIASDVTYHKDKLNRPKDADKMITILGPDHHGYIGRLTAVVAAMLMSPDKAKEGTEWTEFDAQIYASQAEKAQCLAALDEARQKLEVQIFQLVRFLKDGKPAPMRKRDGNIYALIDLINEIGAKVKPNGTPEEKTAAGRDVARFFYLMRNHDTTFDFDLDLAEKQSDENPVFYVQYAHARICSVIAKASEAGIKAGEFKLTDPKEKALLLKILELAAVIEKAADDYAVNRLTSYATELARTYHAFYDACRVIDTANPETSSSRLALCEAARIGLRTVFELLGISAPDRMERDTAG